MPKYCPKTIHAANRRQFLATSGLGFGALAASSLLPAASVSNPFAAKARHFEAKGKSVIFLFMHGGPSHLDTFDPKPALNRLHGQPIPSSFGKVDFQFSNMAKTPLMGSPRLFKRHGQSGLEISDLFANLAAQTIWR